LQKELADSLRTSLASIRDKLAAGDDDDGSREPARGGRDEWDASDTGFEKDELQEFSTLNLGELKERVAEDEKELELMHEHAALTIEHAKVRWTPFEISF
jgi:hypothetical protein